MSGQSKSGEARATCEEFEARLNEAYEKAVEDDNAATGANRAVAKKQAAAAARAAREFNVYFTKSSQTIRLRKHGWCTSSWFLISRGINH